MMTKLEAKIMAHVEKYGYFTTDTNTSQRYYNACKSLVDNGLAKLGSRTVSPPKDRAFIRAGAASRSRFSIVGGNRTMFNGAIIHIVKA